MNRHEMILHNAANAAQNACNRLWELLDGLVRPTKGKVLDILAKARRDLNDADAYLSSSEGRLNVGRWDNVTGHIITRTGATAKAEPVRDAMPRRARRTA